MTSDQKIYRTLGEFYPSYLGEHANRTCRRLHFVGTTLALALLATAIATQNGWLVLAGLVQGYAFAFFFEHNKPATFKHPWLSFLGDWRMWWEMLSGRIRF
jgi:hypothetical protein